ncbi:probable G-protein coupled receptor 139 [Lingula anatina]|uniref:Probable G-protein coupled receptor 139 n=1 Tax=Lingula anatina TaxID=7574 RepID=A0A1S3K8A8_LINAN|nr:probable G-protein coupled receptor 139 [Lingula anatina]XP_013418872.1 probable G-protein coupled receptor 139 [Lingula anatina]|eukprot:XP_013418870.1 probable G-protein coupled receptor 139 [Lingula anatina]
MDFSDLLLANSSCEGGECELLAFNFTLGDSSDDFASRQISAEQSLVFKYGRLFYAYFTPAIIVIGLCGNSLSFNVFISRSMRGLSASQYLAALSISDILVLVVYVFLDWTTRGLPFLPRNIKLDILAMNGVCHMFLYFSYSLRFISVWLIVAFTIERYIGVCLPLKKIKICSRAYARRTILTYTAVGMVISLYKPILSGVYAKEEVGVKVCTFNPEYEFVSNVLDAVFGLAITLVPFLIIAVLNVIMVHKLRMRSKRNKNGMRVHCVVKENKLRLEMTLILIGLSTCFIALNLPYFAVWCFSRYQTLNGSSNSLADLVTTRGVLYITRTIFYINYCSNFFLYSITGACFRKELLDLFRYHRLLKRRSFEQETRKYSPILKRPSTESSL